MERDHTVEQVYRLEARRMLSYIRRRVSDTDEAEDILQEAFARAIEAPNVFRGTDRLIHPKIPPFYSYAGVFLFESRVILRP